MRTQMALEFKHKETLVAKERETLFHLQQEEAKHREIMIAEARLREAQEERDIIQREAFYQMEMQ